MGRLELRESQRATDCSRKSEVISSCHIGMAITGLEIEVRWKDHFRGSGDDNMETVRLAMRHRKSSAGRVETATVQYCNEEANARHCRSGAGMATLIILQCTAKKAGVGSTAVSYSARTGLWLRCANTEQN